MELVARPTPAWLWRRPEVEKKGIGGEDEMPDLGELCSDLGILIPSL